MKFLLNWIASVVACSLLLASTTTLAQDTSSSAAQHGAPSMMGMPIGTPAMGATMNPMTYMNMMPMMMNPMGMMSNPTASCVQCHDGEDIARYQKLMGPMMPMMQQMMNPATMMNPMTYMNPNMYMQMMAAPMDPKTYTEWFNAWTKMMGEMSTPAPAK